jgi:hypothetical protein
VAFRDWVSEERANKRLARELGKPYRDLYEALYRSVKAINNRTFRRWNRIGRPWRQGWAEEDRVQLGSALIEYLVDHSGGYFQKALARHSGKTQIYVVLSPEARAGIWNRDGGSTRTFQNGAYATMTAPENGRGNTGCRNTGCRNINAGSLPRSGHCMHPGTGVDHFPSSATTHRALTAERHGIP